MVNPSVDLVDNVFQHHRQIEVVPYEQGGVPGDVLANIPEDSRLGRLGGAGAK